MENIRIIVAIYCIVLVSLVVISSAIARHKKRFEVIFTYDIDYVFYEIARQLIQVKDSLYDYENTLQILYHDKRNIFTTPISSYQEQYPKIKENIEYLEKLLQKKIFTDNFTKRLAQNYRTLLRISGIGKVTHTILAFLTLGIAKFRA